MFLLLVDQPFFLPLLSVFPCLFFTHIPWAFPFLILATSQIKNLPKLIFSPLVPVSLYPYPDLVFLIPLPRWFQSCMVSPMGLPEFLLPKNSPVLPLKFGHLSNTSTWTACVIWSPLMEVSVTSIRFSLCYSSCAAFSHVRFKCFSGSVLLAKTQARF